MTRGKAPYQKMHCNFRKQNYNSLQYYALKVRVCQTRCYTLSEEAASHWAFLQPRVPDQVSNFQRTGLLRIWPTHSVFFFYFIPLFLILSCFHVLNIWAIKCLQGKSFPPNTLVKYVHIIPRRLRMVSRCFSYGSVVMSTSCSCRGLRIVARRK